MGWTVDATDWTIQSSTPIHDGNFPKTTRSSNTPLSMAHRSSAVQSSAIHFDVGVTDVDQFRNRLYVWDFDDSGSGNWSDGTSKDVEYGPIACHVYESPGTYTVTCTVSDSGGTIVTYEDTVTITNADTVYSGTDTICMSTGSDFTGAPSGCVEVTTTNFEDINNHIATGKRILLKAGDSWTSASNDLNFTYTNIDDVYIGMWGTGTGEDSRGIFTNQPSITTTGAFTESGSMFRLNLCERWIFENISLTSPSNGINFSNDSPGDGTKSIKNITYKNIKTNGCPNPIGHGHYTTPGHIGIAYIGCELIDGDGHIIYTGSENLMMVDTRTEDSQFGHNTRIWQMWRGVIAHCDFSGAAEQAVGQHLIKLHGIQEDRLDPVGPTWSAEDLRYRTEFNVIRKNIFGAGSFFPVTIGPQNGGKDERLRAFIIEDNRFIPEYGTKTLTNDVSCILWGKESVFRNNVFDGQDANTTNWTGIRIQKRGIEPDPDDNWIYNNSFYGDESYTYSVRIRPVHIDTDADGTIVKNNIVNDPDAATGTVYIVHDEGTNTDAGVSNEVLTDPEYVDPTNVTPLSRNFDVQNTSPAVNGGVTVPVFRDIDGTARPQNTTYDQGAYEQ